MTLPVEVKLSASVQFDEVCVKLGGACVLDRISARVPAGSCTAVIGPNGAGKTTLLLALLGEIRYRGRIQVTGGRSERAAIGYVPQRLVFDRGLPVSVLEFMVMGNQRRPLFFGVTRDGRERTRELLAYVRAEELLERRLGALSGGELQRVLLALALGQNPDILLLDEPATGVDAKGEILFCEVLEELRGKWGFTQLMVSHDLSTVTHHATHVICLNRSLVAEGPPQEVLTSETLSAIFGMHMGLVDHRALPSARSAECSSACCRGEDADDA